MHVPFPLAHTEVIKALLSYKKGKKPLPPILLSLLHLKMSYDVKDFSYILHTDSSKTKDFENVIHENMVWRTYKKGVLICEENLDTEDITKGRVIRLLEMKDLTILPEALNKEFDVYKENLLASKKAGVTQNKKTNKIAEKVVDIKNNEATDIQDKPKIDQNEKENSHDKLKETPEIQTLEEKTIKIIDINTHLHSEVDYTGYSHRKKRAITFTPSKLIPEVKKPKFMNLTKSFNINKVAPESFIANENLRFQPLVLTNQITKFSEKSIRMAANINKKPIRLTFVKFHDQIKPPKFCVMKKMNERISDKKIENLINYDEDSDEDWIYEDGESIDSSDSESTEEASEDNEWIDKEGAVETSMKYKKPEICFENIKIEYFKVFDESFINIPLKRVTTFDECLIDVLKERVKCGKNKEDMCRNFAAEHNIVISVVRQKIKELKILETEK